MIPKFFVIGVLLVMLVYSFGKVNASDHGGGGGGGKSGGGGNSGLKVSISFDSLDQNSITFMKGAVQPIFEELSSCVQWDFIPCSTSHIVEDVLQCKDGVEECKIDALHACASHYFKDQPNNLAKFFVCMMTCGDQMAEAQKCANQAGIDWNKLKGCKPCNEAGQWCDNRYKLLNQLHEAKIPGVMFNLKYDCGVEQNAMNDLKGTICQQIKQNNMQCPACDGCGGGGSGGGSSGGGGGSGGGGSSGNGNGHNGDGGGGGQGGGSNGGAHHSGDGGGGNGGGHHDGSGGGGSGQGTGGGGTVPTPQFHPPDYSGCVPGSIGISPIVGAGIVDPPGCSHCV